MVRMLKLRNVVGAWVLMTLCIIGLVIILRVQNERWDMALFGDNGSFSETYSPTGIFFPEHDYFCVSVAGRSYSDVMETCNHEWLHYTVGKKHFCGGVE